MYTALEFYLFVKRIYSMDEGANGEWCKLRTLAVYAFHAMGPQKSGDVDNLLRDRADRGGMAAWEQRFCMDLRDVDDRGEQVLHHEKQMFHV
jgi:hypothetical protein